MTYPLPTRSAGESAANHVADHNEIHDILSVSDLPTGLTTNSTGHLANQNRIHLILNTILGQSLPTNLTASSTNHIAHHNSIAALLNANAFGPRGPYGPQTSSANISGYPSSFTATVGSGGTYANISAAASGAAADAIMQILPGTYSSPAAATLKAGQQFWGHPGGVTLTFPAGTTSAFQDGGSAKASCKIMNISFVGFRNTINCRASGGWEIGYCDINAENGVVNNSAAINCQGQIATPRHWIHHSRLHHTINPIWLYQSRVGALIEDCEVDHITDTQDGSWKVATAANHIVIRHCWAHHNRVGIWFDYHNYDCQIEWCLTEDNAQHGIVWEADPGTTNGATDTQSYTRPTAATSATRYNLIRNNPQSGIDIQKDSQNDISGNILYRNQTAEQIADGMAEIRLYTNSEEVGQITTMSGNNIHHNYVEVHPTIAGQQPKRGASLFIQGGGLPPDPSAYVNNTKNNQWYNNFYVLNRLLTDGTTFSWCSLTGATVAKSFATWKALPQDATSSAEA